METQTQKEMEKGDKRREMVEDMTEEEFLKDLYMFMRKRDTPIERIPHLGFKQIDLFVMYKNVSGFGGYHQVTSQQLWKQVYNHLGGNPRSTSAATCTRRHYEKLLLPYECHKKGIIMTTLPHYTPKVVHGATYCQDGEDGPISAKRIMISMPLHQGTSNLQSDPRGCMYPPSIHYPYYPPNQLPQYIQLPPTMMPPRGPPSPEGQFPFCPPQPSQADRVNEPLELLRHLAEQYKTLAEPLNLTVKGKNQDTNKYHPASSFAPVRANKSPKFLNKPSPLYPTRHPLVGRIDESEAQDAEADFAPYPNPAKEGEAYVIDVKAVTASGGIKRGRTPTPRPHEGAEGVAPKPGSPDTDFTSRTKEVRRASPEAGGHNLGNALPSPSQDNGGKMEIQIPLSMFQTWLKLFGSSGLIHAAKQHLAAQSGQSTGADQEVSPVDMSPRPSPSRWSPAAEDLRVRQRTAVSPSNGHHNNSSQKHYGSYFPSPASNTAKSLPGPDVYVPSYSPQVSRSWEGYDKEAPARANASPVTVPQDYSKSFYDKAPPQGGKDRAEAAPSAMLMVNSGSLLHLTSEEVMKLRKMISSSP